MPRYGFVQSARDSEAIISTVKRGECESCHHAGACAMGQAEGGDMAQQLTARNPIAAQPGDYVEFDLPGHTELRLALLVWAAPVLGLVVGAALGSAWLTGLGLTPDGAGILGAALGAGLAFAPALIMERRRTTSHALRPVISRVVTKAGSSCQDGGPGSGVGAG